MEERLMREDWLNASALSVSDYQALLELRRQTPWGEDWGGERAYSRAPGLSLAELDRAWMIERWRFAYRHKRWWRLPSLWPALLLGGLVLFIAFYGVRAGLAGQLLVLLVYGVFVLVLSGGVALLWVGYRRYEQARRAYEARRAALSRQDR